MKKMCLCLLIVAMLLLSACGSKEPTPESGATTDQTLPMAAPTEPAGMEPSAPAQTQSEDTTPEETEPQASQTTLSSTVPVQDGKPDINTDYTMPDTSGIVDIDPIDISKIDFSGVLPSGTGS